MASWASRSRPATVDEHLALRRGPTEQRPCHLGPTAPTSPASATISPRRTSKETSRKTPAREAADAERHRRSPPALREEAVEPPPDHVADRLGGCELADGRRDHVRPSRRTVTDRRARIPPPAGGSREHRDAVLSQLADRGEEALDLLLLRAAVGSSMTRTLASIDSALAISTTCWSATESRERVPDLEGTPSRAKRRAVAECAWPSRPGPAGARKAATKTFSATSRSGKRLAAGA